MKTATLEEVDDSFGTIKAFYMQQKCVRENCDAQINRVLKLWENHLHIYIRVDCEANHSDIFREVKKEWKKR